MKTPATSVRVRPVDVIGENGEPVMVDVLDKDGKVIGQTPKRAPLRNPYRAQAVMSPDGELLPFNAWLLRRVRKGDLVPIDDSGNVVAIDDLGNVIADAA